MVWSKLWHTDARQRAPVFPGQSLRLYTGPSPPGCGNFLSSTPLLWPHAMMSARRCALTPAPTPP
ncbi:hypothetical protein J4734_19455 [Klebsiella pneumoniae]|uniref:Uncharacterized protein n=1 Tax=Klebsiella pneumoniae TaxID=573 RepID=A0A939NQ78_KLEPN|nr:hypothetical protein [Klebsiella pneumoniae]